MLAAGREGDDEEGREGKEGGGSGEERHSETRWVGQEVPLSSSALSLSVYVVFFLTHEHHICEAAHDEA
jgi:hypothetical protein